MLCKQLDDDVDDTNREQELESVESSDLDDYFDEEIIVVEEGHSVR